MSGSKKCDRFDLEDQITKIDAISDDLDSIADAIINEELSTDEIANMLIGAAAIMRLRATKLFRTFEEAFNLIG